MPPHDGRSREVDRVRDERHPRLADDGQLRVAAQRRELGDGRNAVACLHRRDALTHGLDDARGVDARRERQLRVHTRSARNEVHVQRRVDRDGVHPHQHLARPRHRVRDLFEAQLLRPAECPDDDRSHPCLRAIVYIGGRAEVKLWLAAQS